MLTLRDPIQLHIARNLTGKAEAFGARIMGNYSLLGARYTPKDLLFLLTAPPEPMESQGGMTTLVDQHTSVDVRSVSLDVVNHVINRILLDGSSHFTYQDQVYITSVLNRLGITDVEQFMQQVRQLRIENESTVHLTRLYRQELEQLLERQKSGETIPQLPLAPPQGEEVAEAVRDPKTALSMHILRRLDTANLYRQLFAFQRSWWGGENHVHHNELRLAEQLRFGNSVQLSQLKQQIYQQPVTLLHRHMNRYETGELLEPPRDEEQVLSQAAVSALVSAVDNTVVQVLSRPQVLQEQWLHLENAIWQTAENALTRFEAYHTEYNPPHQPRLAAAQEAWNEYTQELREYTRLYQITHPGQQAQALARAVALHSPPSMVHPRGGQEGEDEEQGMEPGPQEKERDVVREIRNRQERSRLEKLWSSYATVREVVFRQERRLAAYEALRRETLERTAEHNVPPYSPPPAASELLERIARQAVERMEERQPIPLTLREAEEQAPEVLVEQLQRIDQQNRAIFQTVRQAVRLSGPPPTRAPDLPRTMRDGLRALESPELVLRELAQSREEERGGQANFTPQEMALLKQTDPATRAMYQRVLAYQKDPERALELGLVRPAEMGGLQAALKSASEEVALEHPEPAQRQEAERVREESERVIHEVKRLTGRRERISNPPAQPPREVKLVHKQQSTQATEELLEQLQTQHTQRTEKTESRDTLTRHSVHETDVTQVENQVVHQTTEDISELVNRTLARQMKTISEQVYRQMERRLQTERSRRGRM